MSIYLYVKRHKITGLKYLGQTKKDPFTYSGSGIYWRKHCEKHGYDIETSVIKECNSNDEIKYWGEYYSNLWNVCESDEWANLKPETGPGGGYRAGTRIVSEETKKKMSFSQLNRPPRGEDVFKKISESNKGKTRSEESKKKMSEAAKGKSKSEDHKKSLREAAKNRPARTPHSEETKLKIKLANKGRKFTEDHKQKLRNAKKRFNFE